jgi:protein-S-isoprenylcysteine O-methyltransferase Ste14
MGRRALENVGLFSQAPPSAIAPSDARIMLPRLAMLILFVCMVLFYSAAAGKEERKFERSALASEYEAYKQRTGRFIPKLRSHS